MNTKDRDQSERGRRLDEVVTAYLQEVERGGAPDPAEWLARYPDLADELAAFFAAQQQVDQLAAPLRVVPAGAPTVGLTDRTAEPEPGARLHYFGDYELLEEVGRGGMGVVYKARQVSLKRVVALKMILTGQLANDDDVKRFRAEAESAARLQHDGIVPVFEVGQYEGHHYFTMAFIEGESLAHSLTGGLLPPRPAAELTRKIAKAVAYAHTEGVIHRDLKPANILMDKSAEPRLTDFGLAKRVHGAPGAFATGGLTATGQILGTPSYMAPEQASGKKGAVGPPADVYSLGAILYCLLTGRPPFQADNPFDTLLQVVNQDPVPPRQLNAKVPRDLETICLTCLRKEPGKRYRAAGDLVEDLERFLNGQPIQARPTGIGERTWKWAKRRPAAAALIVVSLLAACAPLTVGLILGEQARKLKHSAREANERALAFLQEADRAKKQAGKDAEAARLANQQAQLDRAAAKEQKDRADVNYRRFGKDLYIGDIRLAQQAWEDSRIARVLELLDGQRPERTAGDDLRGFEWHYLKRLCHTELLTVSTAGGVCVAFSPDGTRIASGGYNRVLKIWDAATGKEIHNLQGHSGSATAVWSVVFSPDSKRLASATGEFGSPGVGEIKIWNADTGKEIRHLKGHGASVTGLAFTPDGARLASSGADKKVVVWDLSTGQEVFTLTATNRPNERPNGVAFSPDGTRLAIVHEYSEASGNSAGEVQVLDVATRKELLNLKGHLGRLFSVAYNPAGTRLATTGDSGIKVWDAATGREIHHLPANAARFQNRDIKFSHDGKRLISGYGSAVKVWDATTGREMLSLKGHTGYVLSVAFSPDGKRLASGDNWHVKVWDAAAGQEPVTVPGEQGWWFGTPAFSPDGKRLAVGLGNGPVRICDAVTGRTLLTFKGHTGWVVGVAFSADGKRLASASHDRTVRIWDAATGAAIHTLKGFTNKVNAVAFSPDGKYLATADGDNEQTTVGRVELWDVRSGREIRSLTVPTVDKNRPFVTSVAFSPDGKRLAAGLTQHQRPRNTPQGWEFYSGAVLIWDTATWKELLFLPDNHHVNGVAFSPDGKRIASACLVGTLKVWDAGTGQELFTCKGHTADANGVSFSPDGKRIASASRDGTVRIWDATTGQEALTLPGQIQAVAFSQDGKRLAATGVALTIWDATPGRSP